MYLEKSVEQYLRKEMLKRGGRCIKQTGETGIPDRLCLFPDGRHAFVEMKRPEGKLSPIQVAYHEQLRAMHQAVWVLWNYEDVDRFIKHYFGSADYKGNKNNSKGDKDDEQSSDSIENSDGQ